MKKLHIENGDIVCVVSPNDGGYIGKGVVTEIGNNKARVCLTDVTDITAPFAIGLGYLFDVNDCYKVAEGVTFQGHEVCYEHNEEMDYPYYCPDFDEDCYEIEVTKHNIKLVKSNLTIRALELFFGSDFMWRTAVAEIIGVNPKTNQFVIIDDGNCFDDSWLYSIYDFSKCRMKALTWFQRGYKYPVDYAECIEQEWFYYDGETLNKTTARALDAVKI